MAILLFVIGLVFLIVGAEVLVRGASRLASAFGIAPLVVGLTVVAFGTSSPELAVSIESSLSGQAGIALGNVIGSNIFNVLFILGMAALIVPLIVSQQLVRVDVPLMIGLSVLVLLLSLDGALGWIDGLILVLGLVTYVTFLIMQSRRQGQETAAQNRADGVPDAIPDSENSLAKNLAFIAGGLVLLVVGSGWLVDSAVAFAKHLGVSELVVGLTIVAAGTSLPEVVTSLIAALRGERDIAVGNVVGSNIFNLMGVLGIASIIAPGGIAVSPAVLGFDMPVMIAVALACLPIFFTGGIISRAEGVILLAYYGAYTLYLIMAASHHDSLEGFGVAMLYFVLPLTVITLTVIAIQELRKRSSVG